MKVAIEFVTFWALWWCLLSNPVHGDETTCMTDHEEGNNLHFLCFCDSPRNIPTGDQSSQIFSLADFAYNLSGAFFSKSIFIRFQSCRHLPILLDQNELSRIGSNYFRPNIQIRGLSLENVYHADLNRHFTLDRVEDYIEFPSEDIVISSFAVALIKIERGARFANLIANSNMTKIFIDLKNGGQLKEDDDFNINGFQHDHIYFITNTKEDIPLYEGEDLHVKMKYLTEEMQDRSHMLSLALSLSTIVILIGIFGLVVVANHRQKRKRQLKAILRAKNLGPVLESRKIAREVSDNFLPKYRPVTKSSMSSLNHVGGLTSAEIEERSHMKISKYNNINDLLSGILYRIRKTEFSPDSSNPSSHKPSTASEVATISSRIAKRPETSFFYKESSLSCSPASSMSEQENEEDSEPNSPRPPTAYGDVNHETVEVAIDKATKESSQEETHSEAGSQSSYDKKKIAQKVFVDYSAPPQILKSSAFQGELKEKCMTFFSSVTRAPPSQSGELPIQPRPSSTAGKKSVTSLQSEARTKL